MNLINCRKVLLIYPVFLFIYLSICILPFLSSYTYKRKSSFTLVLARLLVRVSGEAFFFIRTRNRDNVTLPPQPLTSVMKQEYIQMKYYHYSYLYRFSFHQGQALKGKIISSMSFDIITLLHLTVKEASNVKCKIASK